MTAILMGVMLAIGALAGLLGADPDFNFFTGNCQMMLNAVTAPLALLFMCIRGASILGHAAYDYLAPAATAP